MQDHWSVVHAGNPNEMPVDGSFRALLTGRDADAPDGQEPIPDFYATYAEAQARPMGVFETAALVNPAEPGPAEVDIKAAWWSQLTDPSIRDDFPRLAMLNWFEWHKEELEVGSVIDWRLSADPDLARRLLAEIEPDGCASAASIPIRRAHQPLAAGWAYRPRSG